MKLNTALILPTISPFSYQFGGMTAVEENILFPTGSLLDYLPRFESQAAVYFDDFGCVSHSLENALEAVITKEIDTFSLDNQKWLKERIYNKEYPDFSDRDLIVLSGTKPFIGNSGEQVLATAQTKGLVGQTEEDWPMESRDPYYALDNFYAYTRDAETQALADEWKKRFQITGEWVGREKWEEAAKYGALQVYVHAWREKDGVYINPNKTYNHAVLMASHRDKQIFDSYDPSLKTLDSWDSAYYWALKFNIKEKTMDKPTILNNTLVILVQGKGGIGLYLDGKIIVDDVAKVLSVFMARNAKNGFFSGGQVMSLTQDQWDMFDKRTL